MTEIAMSLLSMSARHPEGRDAEYLEWHMLDHLPEQYRIDALRHGQRWVSDPACRAARAASEPPFDDVDHVVQYLFTEPVDVGLADFFALGAELHGAGRMPIALPRRHLAGYAVTQRWVGDAALVDASVLPWRPARGVYLVVERVAGDRSPSGPSPGTVLDLLASSVLDGVAGGWQLRGLDDRHERFDGAGDLEVTVLFLDDDPARVAAAIGERLADRWAVGDVEPLLGAPFAVAVPWRWDEVLPLP